MHVNFDGKYTYVRVKRKAIKNIYFKWDKDDLIVTCNNYLSQREIEKLIKKNQDSLIKLKERTPKSDLKSNEMYYLGEKQIAELPVCAGKSAKKLQPSWYRDYILKLFFMNKEFYFQQSEQM